MDSLNPVFGLRTATEQANNYLALEVPLASHDQPGRRRNRSAAIRSPMPVLLVSLGFPWSLDALLARSRDRVAVGGPPASRDIVPTAQPCWGERGVAVDT